MAGILSVLMSTAAVFLMEFVNRQKEAGTETSKHLEKIQGVLREDLFFFRSFFLTNRQKNGDPKN